ncbi:protein mono-ADP-ribosyltransferase PARP11 isoform X2 [Amphiprion ocellaris]|uniref:protein mono-ADP-ribosyltransferase PARP11 isoform X2 n=1 Tax=Amphiprion ocellaris TaxID=80972 RepID=UPI002411689B|nr:protein mono-ADP-ribosyltransferase PARP11 isoform X2 [Amphiprion ocellaris]
MRKWNIWTLQRSHGSSHRAPSGFGITWQTVEGGIALRMILITVSPVRMWKAMLQTDLNTGRQRRIQRSTKTERSCSCFIVAPVFWNAVDLNRPYQLITLNERTPEYQTVTSYVKNDGLLGRSILSIFRIQNLDLWELFCRKEQQLMRIHGVKDIQEKRLFHGTKITNVDSICKYNFDLRLAERGVYGKGIYFAKYASFADKYSMCSMDPLPVDGGNKHNRPTKIMFLARVIVGKSTVGQANFLKPDHESLINTHDSCVNDINNPNIFVIFDPNQIYPEYLIHYK